MFSFVSGTPFAALLAVKPFLQQAGFPFF